MEDLRHVLMVRALYVFENSVLGVARTSLLVQAEFLLIALFPGI